MKPETGEWIVKAEGDFRTAQRERSAPEWPNFDAACFHAQQCAEKYLKARLIEAEIVFPRVHDLEALLNLVLPVEPAWEELRGGL
jgi:HEPN domain-containing protein